MTAPPDRHAPPTAAAAQAGFTLLELMLVVALLALMAKMVIGNYSALVPGSRLDSEAARVVSFIGTARTEAELRAQPIEVELDLDLERIRMILPPERRVTRDQAEPEAWELQWEDLHDFVEIAQVAVVGGPVVRNGRVKLEIDHNGFMADQVIVLRPRQPDLEDMVWTLQFRGLERGANIVKSEEGDIAYLRATEEFAFH